MSSPLDPVPLAAPPSTRPADIPDPGPLACRADEGFAGWISRLPGSILISTYQAGKVVLVGWDGKQVTVLPRHFDKPMGLAVSAGPNRPARMALATRHAVTVFADAPLLAYEYLPKEPGRYDSLFLPRVTYHTNDINTHDVAFAGNELWLVATRFGCLATVTDEYGFQPRWKPKWVTELAPEDRCHLNGLAMVDGKPKWVTALGETDSPGAWRANKASGGVVVDVDSGEVVVRGLAMPHSPRWANGALWFLNSGQGEIWRLDTATGDARPVAALPGYLRGLSIVGDFALVGMSQIRERHIFGNLPVQQKHAKLLAGMAVVDLKAGRMIGLLEFTGGCQEVFEVSVIPGSRRPNLLGNDKEATQQAFPAPGFAYWVRPENLIADFTNDPSANG